MEGWPVASELPQLASVRDGAEELPVLYTAKHGSVPLTRLAPDYHGDVMGLLNPERYREVSAAYAEGGTDASAPGGGFGAPYRHPRKIWGIGLNYLDHAADLAAPTPDEPASFIKADHTIIGPDEPIILPQQSQRVTAEAELGLVIGRYCRNVSEGDALHYLFGVCPVLDQTAEDILLRNPRFLTRAKNFPTFFSFGPTLIPMETVWQSYDSLDEIEVSTVKNGQVVRSNLVGNMIFNIAHLISFHSQVMPLFPGDIISSGTPGAVQIEPGDVVECRLGSLGRLSNPVTRPVDRVAQSADSGPGSQRT